MKNQAKGTHTPTPWKWVFNSGMDENYDDIFSEIDIREFIAKGYYDNPKLVDANMDEVLGCEEYDITKNKNACAFIVKAVNSHEALVKALRKMLEFSDARIKDCSRSQAEASFADEVSDLLAQIEGE